MAPLHLLCDFLCNSTSLGLSFTSGSQFHKSGENNNSKSCFQEIPGLLCISLEVVFVKVLCEPYGTIHIQYYMGNKYIPLYIFIM